MAYLANFDRIVRRQLSPCVDLSLCKAWFDECIEEHESCSDDSSHALPARVIDVGTFYNDTVTLLETQRSHGSYITLSHRWGQSKPFLTDSTLYEDCLEGFSIEALPQTFQDAIQVTRKLGVRYLWVDSVCIKQYSSADWEIECTKMAQYYHLSICTIACSDARNAEAGFLGVRPTVTHMRCTIDRRSPLGDSYSQMEISYVGHEQYPWLIDADNEFRIETAEYGSVLGDRGWTLQEKSLSHRILYFGKYQSYWACEAVKHFEELAMSPLQLGSRNPLSFPAQTMVEEVREMWYRIMEEYSRRKLTKTSDKFPAISGLATLVQTCLADEYVAGLWSKEIPHGISWKALSGYEQTTPREAGPNSSECCFPSWSWAACKYPLDYQYHLYGRDKLVSKMEILETHKELTGLDPCGRVNSASLIVRAKVKFSVVVAETGLPQDLNNNCFPLVDCAQPDQRIAVCWPDDDDVVLSSRLLCMLIGVRRRHTEEWVGLAVEVVPGSKNTFRRTGYVEGYHINYGCAQGKSWFDDATEQVLELV